MDETVRTFVESLSEEDHTLIILRDELYAGSWDEMLKDLEGRLNAKPFIFKLASRIDDDMVRIRRMRDFEQTHDINLKDLI